MLKLMQDVNTMSLDKFQADVLATKAQYERSDAILAGMGVGWTPSFLSTCYPKASRNLIASFVKDIRKLSIGLVLALYVTFGHENFVKGPANLFTQALADLRLDGLLTLIAMTYGRTGDLLVLLRYPEQLQGPNREFNAQLETASLKKMKDWRTLLLQYLLQQNRSVTGEDKVATNAGECKQYCGMPLLTDLAVMMRIDPLALVHGLREFVTVVYGPVMSFAFPDVQVKAYRNSVLYVNLVSVVDCSVLNWVEQSELRKLASDDRLFGRIAEPGWVLMDFNNHFKCRMGREDLSHIQFNPKLWNLRPVVKDTGEAVGVPQLPGAYAHAKENQQTWLPGSRPLPDQCPRYPQIRRMLLGATSPIIAPRIGAARDAEKRMLKWSGGMEPRFISWNAAAAHTFDFSFPDAWSRKKIKALPSRRPEVSAETWNEVYSSADDLSRLKWSGKAIVVMLEVTRESRGGSYITIEDLAPHGEELVEFLVDDELFYHAGDMAVPARPDSGTDARQGPSGPKPKPDADDDELMDQDDNDDGTGRFPDAWSRKKIKALPSRRPEVSAETWNEVYSSADDLSRLKWSGKAKVVMMEVAKESRGGSYITIEDLAPHGEESVEFLVNDELFYHAGDMTVPARPDLGTDSRQGPSGPRPKPDAGDDDLMDHDDDETGSKTEKPGETDLGALERDLLEYRFSEDDDGEVDGSLLLMAPSSFMSPTKEASADLSPMDPISQARECRSKDPQRLLHESPRRRKTEESMKISFLGTLPEEEWKRYQMELEGKTGATWSRVNFMEKSWDVIRRYGTQSIMKVGLNQPIMREVLEKIVNSMESDVLTESVTEDSADDQQGTKKLLVRRAKKGLKRLKGKTGSRAMNPRVAKSRASAVVTSLTSAGRSGESGQRDGATPPGGEKENLIPPMLLAGLTVTATRSKKTARTLADTKLEMEIISQCGSGGLEDYRPSRVNMAKLKLEGQLDVVEYSRITVPESVHMGDPAVGYVEMLKARNSARGHLMAWSEKRAMQEYLKGLTENSNFNRKEYGTVMSSEANEVGLEKLLEVSWRAALQKYFDETMHAPATVAAYLAHPCTRTDLQVRLAWCLMGIKMAEYEASNDSRSREQELELMEALRAVISKDDSAIAWAKRKDALCFVKFVVDRIPTPVLGECIKIIRQKGVDCERNFLRALLELYQDMPLTVPSKESNDMENYRKLEEVRRYSNKELKVSRELIEAVRGQKEFATLGKRKSFQYVSGIPGIAYNPFVNEEAREAYFDYEQVTVLNFWVEQIKEIGMLMVEQPKLGIILEERVVEPSIPELKGQVSFDCGSWDGPLKTSLVMMWELMKPSWCPHPNAGLIWDMTADIMLDRDDDASLHDLAMIHHLLAMRLTKRKSNPSTELSEEGTPSNWLKQGTCLAQHSGMEGHICNLGHCLITLSEQHRQLARLYGRLSISDKSAMELVADCHGVTDVNLITALGFCSMTSSIESLERLERAHELVTSLSVEIFPGALQTEQKIGGWREALENEMNLKDSEAYHRPTGSKYMVGSSSAPYCNSKYPTHMVVMDARTQQVLVDQLFSVPKCVRLARMSEMSYDLLAKIFRAVPKRSEGELQDVVGEEFMRLNEGNVSEFQKQKASGALPTDFPTIEEKDDLHRILMEVEPLLGASGYRTRRNIVRTHGEYPCHCLAQTLWCPKRGNLILVWDVEELYSTGLPDQNQQVSIVVVSAMLAVRWLEANADTSQQETAVPTPEQLINAKMSHELDLFRTTCKVLRIPKAIERIWSRQRLMPWFRAVMTSWMYERAKRHMSRKTEAYQSFQLDIGPGAYKRAFLTYRNAVTTAVKRVAGTPCVTEEEKKEVLRADLERNVSLCLHNSFCRNREQKVNVDLLPCCKPRLLEQEGWGTARNSLDMLEKVLEDSDAEHQDGEMME